MTNKMKNRDLVRYTFTVQRADAKRRGIPFLLSYEQWCTIWMESGKWEQRGAKRGQYVMSRPGDKGAYEVGNVVICLAEENRAERNRNYPVKGERNRFYGRDMWSSFDEAAKAKHRQAAIATAAQRTRDTRGCFISEAKRGVELS